MVSSASSVRAALRDPWRANPPRPAAEPALAVAAAPGPAAELVVLGAADAEDTVDDCEAVSSRNITCKRYFKIAVCICVYTLV